jgi:7-dehydrocholesterol reductase
VTPRRAPSAGKKPKTPITTSRDTKGKSPISKGATGDTQQSGDGRRGDERQINGLMRILFVCTPEDRVPPAPQLDNMHISFIRAWFWPIILLLWTAPTAQLIPMTVYSYGGSISRAWAEGSLESYWALLPRPSLEGAAIFLGWTLFQGLLLELVPGPTIEGPVTMSGEKPLYVQNGMWCWFITHAAWLILGPLTNTIDFGALYYHWGAMIASASAIGVPLCLLLYWKGKNYPSSRDACWTGRPFFDFFQGIELHPRLCGLNVKQLLNCRVSMMGWSISMLCFAQTQYNNGQLSSGMLVLASLHFLYLAKFFWWEPGYFASIDIIHDRCGYYIVWGVLCWVPSVYCAPGFALVEHPTAWSDEFAAAVFAVGLTALAVNYAADYQRQLTRQTNGECLIWGRKPDVIRAAYVTGCGTKRTSVLLCSGYWGLSRHFNYIPELTLALMWSLPSNSQLALPWIYWLFLFFLLVDRANRDDEKCLEKYGKHWEEYCRRVPYKIIPYVY